MPLFRISRTRALSWGSWAVPTRLLNQREAALVAAIAEIVIPLDDEPGAAQTRAVRYIDQQLDGPLARLRPAYQQGLSAFESASVAETGKSFLELAPEQRQEFLWRLEAGHKLTAFYNMVRSHAEQSVVYAEDRSLFQQAFVQPEHAV